ncbi:protein MIZU-KUSSEI 1-like [Typha angustifolia]|uniref:protein MIZU-KUSSEI 1-like n=1 Tax=Typha angustifolia TaxID=59011 RepID=UPI003C2EEE53
MTESFTTSSSTTTTTTSSTSTSDSPIALLPPSHRRTPSRPARLFRTVRSAFRSFPILPAPSCRLPSPSSLLVPRPTRDGHIHGATRTTGTLFGYRKSRITFSLQDHPRSVPLLLLDLNTPTAKFIQEMGASGLLRVALECEKKTPAAASSAAKTRLLDEPLWSAFINGRSIGYSSRREPTDVDVKVMQLLHAVSMGAGVLPADLTDPVDGELTYMRAYFDRVVGSKDSETFYMLNPEGNSGPELTVFFVRI